MKVFVGKYVIVEKYIEPSFIGKNLTTWRNKQKQLTKVEIHSAEWLEDSFLYQTYDTDIINYRNTTWILPDKKYSKEVRLKFKALNQGIDILDK